MQECSSDGEETAGKFGNRMVKSGTFNGTRHVIFKKGLLLNIKNMSGNMNQLLNWEKSYVTFADCINIYTDWK